MTNPYRSNALGYFAQSVVDPGWENPEFAFFVAHGLKMDGVSKPNKELYPMQKKAEEKGKPFVIVANHSMAYYTRQQYTEGTWPAEHMDYPMLHLKSIMASRRFTELWIDFTDPTDHTGEPGDPAWLEYTLRVILQKIEAWKVANKRSFEVRVLTNWAFMEKYLGGGPAWLHNNLTGVKQPIELPHDASYPDQNEKPAWLGAQAGGPFWWYTDRLVMYTKGMDVSRDLGGVVVIPPTVPNPPSPVEPTEFEKTVLENLAALNAGLLEVLKFIQKLKS